MRISAKADYAVRAMAQLAVEPPDRPVKAEHIARAQGIPLKFLLAILGELRVARLVRSQRGFDGGFLLERAADKISVADVIRAVEGPLANVHESRPEELSYTGPAEALQEVWIAVRASLRAVLESVSIADLASGDLPEPVKALTADPLAWLSR